MSYAETNGVRLHYAQHGEGDPLVLLHGGIGSGDMFAGLLPQLTGRRLIVVDLQGHGRTADVDRPFRVETMADDVAGLIEQLGGAADVLGYSLGGAVALRLAIQHAALVRHLVVISVACRRAGNHPEVVAAFDAMSPAAAEMMKQGPAYPAYTAIAPRPEDFDTMVAKTAELLKVDFDWSDEVAGIVARTLLVFADADSVRPDHVVEFARLLGVGLRDAGWDGSAKPTNQLAVLPGSTHYDILASPLLAPVVTAFLG